MSNLRIVAKNVTDDSSIFTSPELSNGYIIDNLKSPSRSTKIVTDAYGKGSFNFPVTEGGNAPLSLYISPNGSKMYILDGTTIYQYSLIDGDLPSAIYDSKNKDVFIAQFGLFFSTDGTKMYTGTTNKIFYFDLSVAWDITTAVSNAAKDLDLSTQHGNSSNYWFSADGINLYTVDWASTQTVYRWVMSTPWDTSTAIYNSSKSLVSEIIVPFSITLHSDGTTMYALDFSNDTIYQYTLNTPWDITTAFYSNKSITLTLDISPVSVFLAKDNDKKVYMLGQDTDTAYQYELAIDKDIETLVYNSNNQTILLRIGLLQDISAVIFGRHNFPKDTIINIYLYSNIDYTGELYASGDLIITTEQSGGSKVNWGDFIWGEPGITWGEDLVTEEFISSFNYVHWINPTISDVLSIKIVISNITDAEIEFGRLIIGEYIQPTHNISYNHNLQWNESTKQFRASSGGTLRSTTNLPNRKLEFALNTINAADRTIIQDGMRYIGLRKDFYVSLFPEDIDEEKKIDYSGIMKLTKIPSMSEHMPVYYKSKYIMEEV